MKRITFGMAMLLLAVTMAAGSSGWAADQERDRDRAMEQDRMMDQDRLSDRDMYGWEMMSRKEREEHRSRIRSFDNEKKREQYRNEHHNRMQERARKQGLILPDMPAERGGRGMGSGGSGMGSGGGGMGSGGGGRR